MQNGRVISTLLQSAPHTRTPMIKRLVTAAACLLAVVSGKEHVQAKIRRGELASRATNLGGWLLAEYWMAYSSPLYENVPSDIGYNGEYAVMQALGKAQGDKQFEEHWATWITEEDIAEIAKTGLNTVRVSVGFWIINDEDTRDQSELTLSYASGGLKYLDKLINEWALKYDLAVMISLHAHRGAQNGFDNCAPQKMGSITWSNDPANVESSLNFATFIANRYKKSPAFLGLNLMNEPTRPLDQSIMLKYYQDAYTAIREDGNDCIIVTSPWLENQGPPNMADFMTCPTHYNVWHEWHIYYKWGWEQAPKEAMLAEAAKYNESHFEPWTGNPIYMGEWSMATVDEVKLTTAELTNFADIQIDQYEQAGAGWAFWSWKHSEEATKPQSGWSMRQLIRKGIFNVPSSEPTRIPDPKCPKSNITWDDEIELSKVESSSGSSETDVTTQPPASPTPEPQAVATTAPTSAPSSSAVLSKLTLRTSLCIAVSTVLAVVFTI